MEVLSVLLPRRCGVCGLPGEALCQRCLAMLVRIVPPTCGRCGAPGPWPIRRCAECAGRRLGFATARAAIVYDENARALVGAWKERGRRDLSRIAAELVSGILPRPSVDALCFVPGDPDRTLKRGHVTSAGLAHRLGELWEIGSHGLLRRRRSTPRQRSLPHAARRANVSRAFAARTCSPPRVCLVDDVYTTGSTAAACALELRRAGARHVEVVTLARALR